MDRVLIGVILILIFMGAFMLRVWYGYMVNNGNIGSQIQSKSQSREDFTVAVPVNVPGMGNTLGKEFDVGNRLPPKMDKPIVGCNGKYRFGKEELLYDGIWGADYMYNMMGGEKCNWSVKPKGASQGEYGSNDYLKTPEKCMFGKEICSPPDCGWNDKVYYGRNITYAEDFERRRPCFMEKPSIEDVLGYIPRDNRDIEYPMAPLSRLRNNVRKEAVSGKR